MIVSFFVEGSPVTQGSKTVMRGRVFEDRSRRDRLATWRALVGLAAREVVSEMIEGPVAVRLTFVFKRPKSHFTAKGDLGKSAPRYHVQKPDADKLTRAVLDGLTAAGVWGNDSQVFELRVAKYWQHVGWRGPGCAVVIEELTP